MKQFLKNAVENLKIRIPVDTFYTTNASLLSLRFSVKEGNAVHNRIGKTLALRLLVKQISKNLSTHLNFFRLNWYTLHFLSIKYMRYFHKKFETTPHRCLHGNAISWCTYTFEVESNGTSYKAAWIIILIPNVAQWK